MTCAYLRFRVHFLVVCLPFSPILFGLDAILPVFLRPRKYFRCEHCCRCEEKEYFVRDHATGSLRLLLGVLEHFDILGDALNFKVIALHFILKHQKVKGVTTRASRL